MQNATRQGAALLFAGFALPSNRDLKVAGSTMKTKPLTLCTDTWWMPGRKEEEEEDEDEEEDEEEVCQ
jgi:hypothetical protein